MTVTYWTNKSEHGGHESAHGNTQKESGEWINTSHVSIHRLCAVAWFGFDTVQSWDVHHRVPIPWLNVESNLVALPSVEHSHLTAKFGGGNTPQTVVEDVTEGLADG